MESTNDGNGLQGTFGRVWRFTEMTEKGITEHQIVQKFSELRR
jgi:hypothetical protein